MQQKQKRRRQQDAASQSENNRRSGDVTQMVGMLVRKAGDAILVTSLPGLDSPQELAPVVPTTQWKHFKEMKTILSFLKIIFPPGHPTRALERKKGCGECSVTGVGRGGFWHPPARGTKGLLN